MTEKERAAALADAIESRAYAGHFYLTVEHSRELLTLLRFFARPAPADLREAIEDVVADIDNGVGRSDRRKIADAILSLLPQTQAESGTTRLLKEHVEWVVNDIAELGVKIGDQFFWLYKGSSLVYEGPNEDTDPPRPHYWRYVGKREFGECCHPINYADPTRVGTVDMNDGKAWMVVPGTGHLDRAAGKEG